VRIDWYDGQGHAVRGLMRERAGMTAYRSDRYGVNIVIWRRGELIDQFCGRSTGLVFCW
jgi:hypothetical protein